MIVGRSSMGAVYWEKLDFCDRNCSIGPKENKMAQIKSPVKMMKLNTEHNFSFEIIGLVIFVDLQVLLNM